MEGKVLCGMSDQEIAGIIKPKGFKDLHAHQIAVNLYKRRFAFFGEFTGTPVKLKEFLNEGYSTGLFRYKDYVTSGDKTVKYLFETADGRRFETVYIPDGKRHTVCVSTQSGCRMGCSFCVSGSYGYHGDLTASEILNQVLGINESASVTHVVFMGMGEPLDNIDNVLKACRALTSQWGLALSPRHITVSTVGIKENVERFLNESDCNLTFSLHSPFHEERKDVIPAEKKNSFKEIIELMKGTMMRKGRRLSVAYAMIDGLNDTDIHLDALKTLFADSTIRVNLLPFHAVNDYGLRPSSGERMQYFRLGLNDAGISTTVRKSRGEDIAAACGLLAARELSDSVSSRNSAD